jgi:hypothetical protein
MQFTNRSDKEVRVGVYTEAQMGAQDLCAQAQNVQPGTTVHLAPNPVEPAGYYVAVIAQHGDAPLGAGPGRVPGGATVTFTGAWELQVA